MLNTVKATYQNGHVFFEESVPSEISSAKVLVTFLGETDSYFHGFPQLSEKEIVEKLNRAELDIQNNKVFTSEQIQEALHL